MCFTFPLASKITNARKWKFGVGSSRLLSYSLSCQTATSTVSFPLQIGLRPNEKGPGATVPISSLPFLSTTPCMTPLRSLLFSAYSCTRNLVTMTAVSTGSYYGALTNKSMWCHMWCVSVCVCVFGKAIVSPVGMVPHLWILHAKLMLHVMWCGCVCVYVC